MLVLVVNAGSSSLKSQLIETDGKICLMKSLAERVGTEEATMSVSFSPEFEKQTFSMENRTVAQCLEKLLEVMVKDSASPITDLKEIGAIGNRIVAGGEYFSSSVIIDETNFDELKKCEELAPLHNPAADECILMMHHLLPHTPQVAVFDTAFHSTMPPKAYMYPIPLRYYKEYHIRRYGAHGTSHRYAAQQAANLLDRPLSDLGLITCHLGNGASITAVNHGKSIDTSMGFTPLAGIMMGTRSGTIDPAIISYIMRREGVDYDEMDHILNKESGMKGIAGFSSDMRDIMEAAKNGNENAQLAVDMYVYRIQKKIGSYYAVMTRTDAVVMTAGIGENSAELREKVFAGLAHMGMILDKEKNQVVGAIGTNRIVSVDDSPIKICVVTTDEEMRIARETDALVFVAEMENADFRKDYWPQEKGK